MRCDECKYGKVKTIVLPDGTLQMDRFCFHEPPFVQLVPGPRGVGQITYRAKVEDDDLCSKFSKKDTDASNNNKSAKAASPESSIIVDPV